MLRLRRKTSIIVLAVFLIAALVFSMLPTSVMGADSRIADDSTYNTWHEDVAFDNTTKNIGRIWSDKSVSTEDIKLTKGLESIKVPIDDSQFLVGYSTMSSAAEIHGVTTKPLDIVLVLDVSGSMGDYMYSPIYEADMNTNKTYYIKANTNTNSGYRGITYSDRNRSWGYENWNGSRTSISPKTSASSDGHQAYDRSTKLEVLKRTVNEFIDKTAEQNRNLDPDKQSRITLIKFAHNGYDNPRNNIGNSFTEQEGYNRTQILCDYTVCTDTTANTLKGQVNDLTATGATYANAAMTTAKAQVDYSKANNIDADRAVIFFTDGVPTTQSDFDSYVANGAIATSKTIKGEGTKVYTIGVYDGADPLADPAANGTANFNKFMHGVSSNYPNAETYTNLNQRTPDSNYYKSASNAEELDAVFDQIQEELINSAKSPTTVEAGNPHSSGYVTFTDTLGDYMQVDDVKAIVYGEKKYDVKTTQDLGNNTTRYVFEHQLTEADFPNPIYALGNIKDILIDVTKSDNLKDGDVVKIQIPASLLPIKMYRVDKDGNLTITDTFPARVFYGVSMKPDAMDKIANPDQDMLAYIDANRGEGNTLNFYSNKYNANSSTDVGAIGATTVFEPDKSNVFYYFQEDADLYIDEECTQPLNEEINVNSFYYYTREYYVEGQAGFQTGTIKIPKENNELLIDYAQRKNNGDRYIEAGTPRTTSLTTYVQDKAVGANKTETSPIRIKPKWEPEDGKDYVNVYLGNNGKMTVDIPGSLTVSKTVNAAQGYDVPEKLRGQEFEFTITDLDLKNGKTYTAKKNVEGTSATVGVANQEITISERANTFTLKDGESITIYGIAPGTKYTVTETAVKGFTCQNVNSAITGTIAGDTASTAEFTNVYKPNKAILAEGSINVSKAFLSTKETAGTAPESAWEMNSVQDAEFTMVLAPKDNAPMPETDSVVLSKDNTSAGFGAIEYDYPGVYKYTITEENGQLAGVGYSQAEYEATVTVTDEGGKLEANAAISMVKDENGEVVTEAVTGAVKDAAFTNVYPLKDARVDLTAVKKLEGATLKDGGFEFKLTRLEGAPMPEGTNGNVVTVTNVGEAVSFGSIPFDISDAGSTFKYEIEEVIPDDKVTGMTYDSSKYTVEIAVATELKDGVTVTSPTVTIKNAAGTAVDAAVFNNKYEATSVNVGTKCGFAIGKELIGKSIEAGEFSFTVKPADQTSADKAGINATGQKVETTAAANGTCQMTILESMILTKGDIGKTYSYQVTEDRGNADYYEYDNNKYEIVIKDIADRAGEITATVVIEQNDVPIYEETVNSSSENVQKALLSFTNKYKSSTTGETAATVNADKTLKGRNLKDGEFTFVIATNPVAGQGSIISRATNDANGNIEFAPINYHSYGSKNGSTLLSDAIEAGYATKSIGNDGTVTYTLSYSAYEIADNVPGVTQSNAVHNFNIIVTDNGKGRLTAQTQYGEGKNAFAFENVYSTGDPISVGITGAKLLNVADQSLTPPDITGKYNFTISAVTEGAPLPRTTSVTNGDGGNVSFDGIKFSLEDLKDVEADANGVRTKTFEYRVAETGSVAGVANDGSAKTFQVTLTDDGKGTLKATTNPSEGNLFTFVNTYSVKPETVTTEGKVEIKKVLSGRALKDGEFKFFLMEGQDVVAEATNDASGNIVFGPIEYNLPGVHEYTVFEEKGNESTIAYDANVYKVQATVTDNGRGGLDVAYNIISNDNQDKIEFINTYNPKDPNNPSDTLSDGSDGSDNGIRTGDEMNLLLLLMLLGTSALIAVVLLARKKA